MSKHTFTENFLIRTLQCSDRQPLINLLSYDAPFTSDEVEVAVELIDAALEDPQGDYRVLVGILEEHLVGYICFGPTPMTEATWDLYWVVTHSKARGKGVGRALVERMEAFLRQLGAQHVRVETSQSEGYGAAHRFYEHMHYPVVARFADFYKPGDDLLSMYKKL